MPGLACKFTSGYDVSVAPVVFSSIQFAPIMSAPPALRLADDASSLLSIAIGSGAGNTT